MKTERLVQDSVVIRGHHLHQLYYWWVGGPKYAQERLEYLIPQQYPEQASAQFVTDLISLFKRLSNKPSTQVLLVGSEKDTICNFCPERDTCPYENLDGLNGFDVDLSVLDGYGFVAETWLTARELKQRIKEKFAK